jgi:hypothetical protein
MNFVMPTIAVWNEPRKPVRQGSSAWLKYHDLPAKNRPLPPRAHGPLLRIAGARIDIGLQRA